MEKAIKTPLYPFFGGLTRCLVEQYLDEESFTWLCATAVSLPALIDKKRFDRHYPQQEDVRRLIPSTVQRVFEHATKHYVLLPQETLREFGAAVNAAKAVSGEETIVGGDIVSIVGKFVAGMNDITHLEKIEIVETYKIIYEEAEQSSPYALLFRAASLSHPVWRTLAMSSLLTGKRGHEIYMVWRSSPVEKQQELYSKFIEGARYAAEHNAMVHEAAVKVFFLGATFGYLDPTSKHTNTLVSVLEPQAIRMLKLWLPEHYVRALSGAVKDNAGLKALYDGKISPVYVLRSIISLFDRRSIRPSPFREAKETLSKWLNAVAPIDNYTTLRHFDSLIKKMIGEVKHKGALFGAVLATGPLLVSHTYESAKGLPTAKNIQSLIESIGIPKEKAGSVWRTFLLGNRYQERHEKRNRSSGHYHFR